MSRTKYREQLSKYTKHEITLHCSNFQLSKADDERTFLILRNPTVMKIAGSKRKGNWVFEHLWVNIPDESTEYIERYLPLMRKIAIDGRVSEYRYKDTGRPQVGVYATNIKILKYNKDIAKKYNLSPGQLLSKTKMDLILEKEGLI